MFGNLKQKDRGENVFHIIELSRRVCILLRTYVYGHNDFSRTRRFQTHKMRSIRVKRIVIFITDQSI